MENKILENRASDAEQSLQILKFSQDQTYEKLHQDIQKGLKLLEEKSD